MGTNGHVAWSFCFYADPIDYFREVIQLDDGGRPVASRFGGEWKPLVTEMERYDVRAVSLLDSEAATVEQPRFATFDGRRILSIEGRPAMEGEDGISLGDGLSSLKTWTAMVKSQQLVSIPFISMWAKASACTTTSLRPRISKSFVKFSGALPYLGHFVVSDKEAYGHELSHLHAVTICPGPRMDSASLRVPIHKPFSMAHNMGATPLNSLRPVKWTSRTPHPLTVLFPSMYFQPRSIRSVGMLCQQTMIRPAHPSITPLPTRRTISAAPGPRISRAAHHRLVAKVVADKKGDVEMMAQIQADHQWPCQAMVAFLFEALKRGRTLSEQDDVTDGTQRRIKEMYVANEQRFVAAEQRLVTWADDEYKPVSVETFYHQPTGADKESAVATMLFHSWASHFVLGVLDDENIPSASRLTDPHTRTRVIENLLAGRGADNPRQLTSWMEMTQESIFCGLRGTDAVETSDEVILLAFKDALDFWRAHPMTVKKGLWL